MWTYSTKSKSVQKEKEEKEMEKIARNEWKMKQLKFLYDKKWSLVWSPLNTYFGPIYLFFRNPEPWPTLRAWQVHFDQTRILKLKGTFLEEFSPTTWHRSFLFTKTKSLNQSPILDELWIPKCMMEQSNEKMKKKSSRVKTPKKVV